MKFEKPPLVCTLVYDQLCTFEYGIATEIFALARSEFEKPLYRFKTIAAETGRLEAVGGLEISAEGGLEQLKNADFIIIPGWRSIHDVPAPQLLHSLRRANRRGTRILSICSGVFPLACSGLLDGKSATTHWRYSDYLQRKFPNILVKPNVLYVDEGSVLTSAGSAAGIDLCLHVVRQQYGQSAANIIARSLVLPAHREGGQAQFTPRIKPACSDDKFGYLLDEIRSKLNNQWSIELIATKAKLSKRTLLRRFKYYTGESPITWLNKERLYYAGELLEITDLNIDQVSHTAGFSTAELFRLHFKRMYQISPSRYREQFREQ